MGRLARVSARLGKGTKTEIVVPEEDGKNKFVFAGQVLTPGEMFLSAMRLGGSSEFALSKEFTADLPAGAKKKSKTAYDPLGAAATVVLIYGAARIREELAGWGHTLALAALTRADAEAEKKKAEEDAVPVAGTMRSIVGLSEKQLEKIEEADTLMLETAGTSAVPLSEMRDSLPRLEKDIASKADAWNAAKDRLANAPKGADRKVLAGVVAGAKDEHDAAVANLARVRELIAKHAATPIA